MVKLNLTSTRKDIEVLTSDLEWRAVYPRELKNGQIFRYLNEEPPKLLYVAMNITPTVSIEADPIDNIYKYMGKTEVYANPSSFAYTDFQKKAIIYYHYARYPGSCVDELMNCFDGLDWIRLYLHDGTVILISHTDIINPIDSNGVRLPKAHSFELYNAINAITLPE